MPSRFEKQIDDARQTAEHIHLRIAKLQREARKPKGMSEDSKRNLVKRILCLQDELFDLDASLRMMLEYRD